MNRVTCVLAVVGCLVCGAATSAQPPPKDLKDETVRREQRLEDPARYAAMIVAYVAGDTAHSVDLLAADEWDEARLRMQLFQLDHAAAVPERVWRAAPMLHVDVALKLDAERQPDRAVMHLQFASNLLGLGIRERGDSIRPLAERLYVAVARMLEDLNFPYVAVGVLQNARDRLPGRAAILYASGTLAELLATEYALIDARIHTSPASGRMYGLESLIGRRNGRLNDAADWLREAAALAPDDDLIGVHLGRVQALRQKDDESFHLLDSVLKTTKDDATAYLAGLFIAGLRERQNRLDEAADAYRAALARFPFGHAATVGLSEVLQRTGKGAASRDLLRALVTEARGPAREPLWWYHFDPPRVAAERLDALRKEVRQ